MQATRHKPQTAFGRILRALREARGWSITGLAAKAGMTQPALSYYERGRSEPQWINVVALAAALEVPVGAFAGEAAAAPAPKAPTPPLTDPIPASIVCSALWAIMHVRIGELGRQPANPGRQRQIATLREQILIVQAVQGKRHQRFAAGLDAGSLGWLCAWARGMPEAPSMLTRHLEVTRHPKAKAMYDVPAGSLGEALRALIGEE